MLLDNLHAMTLCRVAPLVTDPVTIFFIVMVIILLAPLLMGRIRIPHIVGMIAAGIAVGPYGLNILDRDSSFSIFGQVGLLYLMFLAGLEIDMYHLRRNLTRGTLFGLLTFLIPLGMGVAASIWVLNIKPLTATLLAVMYASHTLIGYPVASRYGVTRSPAVLISVVGTIVAVVGSLLVLAAVMNIHAAGGFEITSTMWLAGRLVLYCLGVLYLFPRVTRMFLKRYSDPVTQYVFIMALMMLAAWTAKEIGLEQVLGAFLAGLVLNRYVPATSPLMGRIEFVGNALFIPYFLISVGMMINLGVAAQGDTLAIAGVMLAVALVGKWLPAWGAQRLFGLSGAARRMMFGLTTAHTAVALAVVTIGYNMTGPDGARLVDEPVLNATILVILVTCAIAPMVTASAAARLRIEMLADNSTADTPRTTPHNHAHVLIAVANPMTVASLTELAMLMRVPSRHAPVTLDALHVRGDNSAASRTTGRDLLESASRAAAAVDRHVETIERFDPNAVTGIVNTVQERDYTDIVLGMHRRTSVIDSFMGAGTEQLLRQTRRMVVISRCFIPLNTVTRIVVWVPAMAHYESGFARWVTALGSLGRELGCRLIFNAAGETCRLIKNILHHYRIETRAEYNATDDLGDRLIMLADKVLDDDLFVVVTARPGTLSHDKTVQEMPQFLERYFAHNNLAIIYPGQQGDTPAGYTFIDPTGVDMTSSNPLLQLLRRGRRLFNDTKLKLRGH